MWWLGLNRKSLARLFREICNLGGDCPEQQQDKFPHVVQALVVMADNSNEADEMKT